MAAIQSIDELRKALSTNLVLGDKGLKEKFDILAISLFNNFQIKKGDRYYWMTELEFYLYHDGHKDIITYPRACAAGTWFFHASGVDITFESKVKFSEHPRNHKQMPFLTKDAVFGGILLRGIKPVEMDGKPISGPMNVCDELFDRFDAFAAPSNFPNIVEASEPRGVIFKNGSPEKRYGLNINAEKKVHDILSYNYSGIDLEHLSETELVKMYKNYFNEGYRYFASNQ